MSNKPKPPRSAAQLMKAAGATEDLPSAVAGYNPPTMPAIPKTLPQGTVGVVNSLFKELQAIFPAWKQAWPTDAALSTAKRSWIKAFIVAEINTLEQIRFGIERCRSLGTDFAPSVGKFIKLCQPTPEMLGIPSHDKAFREALENAHPSRFGNRTWSHEAVRHAALQCEMHNLGDLIPEKASKVFDRAYDITIRMLMQGKPLEDIAIGIGHDSQKSEVELAEEYANQRQARLLEIQAIPCSGAVARAQLMAKFGKKIREQRT
ncbi:replication protein P [Pseudomonas sp. RGM2987]|uniref:replication protein P n=1 Tax=Pseudomonas sp. RGM2987 TaxID=2930090 RepID=UPI001FD6F225|nr:replication protein P [Pseudomonas sp. RGM2987]MCJ8207708.1 replication protein P [Pseudomonas sp. RGM2987]